MERTPHILVVDDHRDIRDLLARFLTKHGFRASVAETAAAARKAMQAAEIDLVVLDIMMPGEDGLSLTRFLRESTRRSGHPPDRHGRGNRPHRRA